MNNPAWQTHERPASENTPGKKSKTEIDDNDDDDEVKDDSIDHIMAYHRALIEQPNNLFELDFNEYCKQIYSK